MSGTDFEKINGNSCINGMSRKNPVVSKKIIKNVRQTCCTQSKKCYKVDIDFLILKVHL